MNRDIIEGNWKEVKGKLKQQFGKLTDDDIATMRGTYDELEGVLQKKYGYTKDQADKAIDQFIEENDFEDTF